MELSTRTVAVVLCCLGLAACGPDEDCGSSGGGGCGPERTSPSREPRPAPDRATLVLHPVEVRGGAFVEGFVAAYDVDPIDRRGIDGIQYDQRRQVMLSPGLTDVRVLVHPCDSTCGTWEELAGQYDAQLAAGGVPAARDQLVRCTAVVDVEAGERAELTPVVQVGGGDGGGCELQPAGSTGPDAAAG